MRFVRVTRLPMLFLLLAIFSRLVSFGPAQADTPATFTGGQVCAGCHATQADQWKDSHHALAMQKATDATVLGDFAGGRLEQFGVVTTFSRSGDKFIVHTDNGDGGSQDYEIAYTFGAYPLQQYLIAFPGGRLQALGVAWDSRPKDQGGQRWFPLYPDRTLAGGDSLHWTGRDQTWNYMCANCHSTNLQKNYDLSTDTYATTWSEINVSCESCHGPGSQHVAWAQSHSARTSAQGRMGLLMWPKATDNGRWEMNPETGIAGRTEPLVSTELDVCAACHARRKVVVENPKPGVPLLDSYLPAYLEPGLYHADGQIDGEVYEYGSFIQSRMHQAGVTCSNCHEPHGLKLRAAGNNLCAQCHLPTKFDVTEHYHHQPGSAGAQCVNCHMPTKTYMVVDARRDHSLRVPRPDLSSSNRTPNACTQCHADKPADWAAGEVAAWFPQGRQTLPQYGSALQAGRTGAPDAEQQLDRLILDQSQPAIARGSALLLLPRYASPASETAIKAAIDDPDPFVRAAVPRALPAALSRPVIRAVGSLLADPVRAVRIEAARILAGVDPHTMTPEQQTSFASAYRELFAAEMVDAERPEAHLNLGLLDIRQRLPDEADAQYRMALRLDPKFVPALVNLADLDRMRGLEQQGGELLRKAIAIEPGNAGAQHALGLLLVREHNYGDALPLLRQASELAPDNAHYAYVYAIALNSGGASGPALAVLEQAHRQNPTDREVLVALVSIASDKGDTASALRYAHELSGLFPMDMQARAMVLDLEKTQDQK